jgi:hypothetical protein
MRPGSLRKRSSFLEFAGLFASRSQSLFRLRFRLREAPFRSKNFCRFMLVALTALAGLSGVLLAQVTTNDVASVTFTLDFPDSDPSHYSIAVNTAGHAKFESAEKTDPKGQDQNYESDFEVSPGNRDRIFEWAKQARYFEGKVDAGNSKLAFTGEKTLSYQDGQRSFTARYNYSNLEPVRELTTLFQNIEGTLDYGRRLAYLHKYQKLALDDELKRMVAQARQNELSEVQGVTPVLQAIVDDPSVMNMARARAKELIQMGSSARPAN